MANKNTKRKNREFVKAGDFVKYVHKKKTNPFPQPKDAGMSLATQHAMFNR